MSECRVVVADSDPDTAEILALCFERLGCESYAAISGAEAIAIARHVTPHVAMLDVSLDGCAVARELRGDIYLVALTSRPDRRTSERVRDAGFDQQLLKPFGLEALRRVVATVRWRQRRAGWTHAFLPSSLVTTART